MSRQVCSFASQFDSRKPSTRWLETIEAAAQAYRHADPKRPGADFLRLAAKHARMARKALARDDAEGTAMFALAALQAAWQAEIADARVMIDTGVRLYRSGQGQNETRQDAAQSRYSEWQKKAVSVWRRHPDWSNSRVAQEIDPLQWNTIRRHIKRK